MITLALSLKSWCFDFTHHSVKCTNNLNSSEKHLTVSLENVRYRETEPEKIILSPHNYPKLLKRGNSLI